MTHDVALCYSDTPDWPKMRWMHEAFTALGLKTRRVRTVEELRAADAECDIVVFQNKSGAFRWPNLQPVAPGHRALWVQVWCDLILEDRLRSLEQQRWFKFAPIMRAMDLVTVKERDFLGEYRSLGIHAEYLDQGAPDCDEIDRDATREWDVLFWGGATQEYNTRRRDIAALVRAGFKVAWASHDSCLPSGVERLPWTHPDKLPGLASRAACVLSVDVRHDLTGYWSDRFWMALGMGCVVLRRATPGLPEGPYLTYRDHNELCQQVARVLADPAKARKTGMEARQWARTNHSITNRCRTLLEMASRTARNASAAVV